jgi:hypothetical protein
MLFEIAQKPTMRAYSTRKFLINTSVFFETMYQDKFVLVKNLHTSCPIQKICYPGDLRLLKFRNHGHC